VRWYNTYHQKVVARREQEYRSRLLLCAAIDEPVVDVFNPQFTDADVRRLMEVPCPGWEAE